MEKNLTFLLTVTSRKKNSYPRRYPSAITFSPLLFCPCSPWRPARPRNPWRCGWPRCWGRRQAGFQARSVGTPDPASRHNHLLPAHPCRESHSPLPIEEDMLGSNTPPSICSSSVMLLRSGRPALPNSCWVIVIFNKASSESTAVIPASAADAAAALLASSSCRCLCSSMDTRSACGADNGVNSKQQHAHKRFGSFKDILGSTISYQGQFRVRAGIHSKLKVASAKAKHGTALPSQNGGTDEGIGKARARGHSHQVGTSPILAV
uniref:Uncharacterized protein n=1 Tax=Chelydra serpentina TaxID=8475 RepID=A0A8C3SMU6_CHESE